MSQVGSSRRFQSFPTCHTDLWSCSRFRFCVEETLKYDARLIALTEIIASCQQQKISVVAHFPHRSLTSSRLLFYVKETLRDRARCIDSWQRSRLQVGNSRRFQSVAHLPHRSLGYGLISFLLATQIVEKNPMLSASQTSDCSWFLTNYSSVEKSLLLVLRK